MRAFKLELVLLEKKRDAKLEKLALFTGGCDLEICDNENCIIII